MPSFSNSKIFSSSLPELPSRSKPGRSVSIQRPTKLVDFSSSGALPVHMLKQPCTPPQLECPSITICATFKAVTAYSMAAEVPF